MRILRYKLGVALLTAAVSASGALAQQQSQDEQQNQSQSQAQGTQQNQDQGQQPIPAYRSPLAGLGGNGDEGNAGPEEWAPDTSPLAGAESISVGVRGENRSYWQPNLRAVITGDSNALGSTSGGWTDYGSVLGGVGLRLVNGVSNLYLTYLGGGTFSNDSNIGNSTVQEMGLNERITWHRSSLSFMDQFADLPEASFGYGAVVGISPGAGAGIGLQPGFASGQSILTPSNGQEINNSFVTQFNTNLTHRSSFTLVGGYSLSHFFNSGLFDYADLSAQGGYNYQVTAKDTIAILYHFDQDRYSGFSPTINNHTVHLSYGRRVTGRLALQIAGGPEFSFYPSTISTSGGASANSATYYNWSADAGLTYRLERASLGVTYTHWVSPGSGVFTGALTDQVSGTLSHQLSRAAIFGLNGGYARNKTLGITALTTAPSNQVYDYAYAGATFTRPLSRTVALNLSYQFQYQDSNVGFCTEPGCGTSFTRHIVSLSLGWIARPMAIR